jgi:hypothetical protein
MKSKQFHIISLIVIGIVVVMIYTYHMNPNNEQQHTEGNQKAIALAVEYIQKWPGEYKLEPMKVEEKGDKWLIYFDKVVPSRPAYGLVSVDKKSGEVNMVPLR